MPLCAVTRSHAHTGRVLVRAIPQAAGGSGGGGTIVTSDTAPESPALDTVWFDTSNGFLYVYFDDGDSTQWVEVRASLASDALFETRVSTLEASVGSIVPSGVIMQWAGISAPAGYLLCDGAQVSRSSYGSLFAAIGTTYGTGNGSTTFNLPDLRGRVAVGRDGSQTEFDVLGETGGAKTHTLTINEMPSHEHGIRGGWGAGSLGAGEFRADGNNPATRWSNTFATGGGGAHNNLQPYIVTNYIIKA
jgi:microcystin-dependent protein